MTLARATESHRLSAAWVGTRIQVRDDLVEAFSAAVGAFFATLGEEQSEAYWADVVGPLRKIRWRLATVPLPVGHPALGLEALAAELLPRLQSTARRAEYAAAAAEAVARSLRDLCTHAGDPLGDAVRTEAERLAFSRRDAILVLDGETAAACADQFLPKCGAVLTPQALRRTTVRHVIALGVSAWYPAELLRAPRAEGFSFVHFDWLRDSEPMLALLEGARDELRVPLTGFPGRAARSGEVEDSMEWRPRFEWGALTRSSRERAGEGHGAPVDARLLTLASRDAVYVEATDSARVLVAEVSALDEIHPHWIGAAAVRSGDYLVLRTQGEGDYVRDVADSLLGARASFLRHLQARWTRGLAERVAREGIDRTVAHLRRAGAPRADAANVRRWALPNTILPRDPRDRAAICRVLGESETELWQAMAELRRAHIAAGNHVRQLLLAEFARSGGGDLHMRGWHDFDVEEIEGEGTLRVARVLGIADSIERVPASQLRRPLPIPEHLWPG